MRLSFRTVSQPRTCGPGLRISTRNARLRGGRSCRETAPTPSCGCSATRAPRPPVTSSLSTAVFRKRFFASHEPFEVRHVAAETILEKTTNHENTKIALPPRRKALVEEREPKHMNLRDSMIHVF